MLSRGFLKVPTMARNVCRSPQVRIGRLGPTSTSRIARCFSSTPTDLDKQTIHKYSTDDNHQEDVLKQDQTLQEYCQKVGMLTGKFLGVTALSGVGTIGLGAYAISAGMGEDFLMAVWTGSAAGSFYHAWQLGKVDKTESQKLQHAYWMHGLMGVIVGPSLLVFSVVIPHATIATGALIAGPIYASLRLPKGSLLPYGPALYTALFGLVGVGATSLFGSMMGYPSLGDAMHSVDLYAGVGLFTLYNAYDTHKMIADFEAGKMDHVSHAANYSLNALNLFIRMLELFGRVLESTSSLQD